MILFQNFSERNGVTISFSILLFFCCCYFFAICGPESGKDTPRPNNQALYMYTYFLDL